jgi:hypothetical protein
MVVGQDIGNNGQRDGNARGSPGRDVSIRLTRVIATSVALAWGAAGASAQTMDEAVRGNAILALSLCLSTVPDQTALNNAFTAAGFAYTPEDWGGGEIHHWFEAPANTVGVMVQGQGREGFCRISTNHMGVTAAVPFVGEALNSLYPGMFTYGEMEGGPPRTPQNAGTEWGDCTGYIGWSGQRPIVVSIGNAGQDPNCAEDGTSQIMVSM